MCMSSKTPTPAPTPQEIQQPDSSALSDKARRNRQAGATSVGSLLTGPSGVAQSALTTSKATLLGQ